MKKILLLFIFTTTLFMSACMDNDTQNCEDGYSFNEEERKCLKDQDNIIIYDNPLNLNLDDFAGWDYTFLNDESSTVQVFDEKIVFHQKQGQESLDMQNKIVTYNQLSLKADKVYNISFTAYGTPGEKFLFKVHSNKIVTSKSFELDGTEQMFSIRVYSSSIDELNAELSLYLGAFKKDSQLLIYNVNITEEIKEEAEINILFVGNSFTYYNDMPNMLSMIGISNGYKDIHVEHVSFGGTTLEKYATPTTEHSKAFVSKMNERKWDYVILQEQSIRPITNKTSFYESTKTLTEYIKSKGATVLMFSTWAYRDGSEKLKSTGLSYEEFYNSITSAYLEVASKNNVSVVPVGTAFYNMNLMHPEVDLLSTTDDFHPNIVGSYLTASMFYNIIFNQENNYIYVPSNISNEVILMIQDILKIH